jgi:hypothetical protein
MIAQDTRLPVSRHFDSSAGAAPPRQSEGRAARPGRSGVLRRLAVDAPARPALSRHADRRRGRRLYRVRLDESCFYFSRSERAGSRRRLAGETRDRVGDRRRRRALRAFAHAEERLIGLVEDQHVDLAALLRSA